MNVCSQKKQKTDSVEMEKAVPQDGSTTEHEKTEEFKRQRIKRQREK